MKCCQQCHWCIIRDTIHLKHKNGRETIPVMKNKKKGDSLMQNMIIRIIRMLLGLYIMHSLEVE